MLLSVKDRLNLLAILPKEGDYRTLFAMRDLVEELHFPAEEQQALGLRLENNRWQWDAAAEGPPRAVAVSRSARRILAERLEALSIDGQLTLDTIGLYELFVEPPPGEPCRGPDANGHVEATEAVADCRAD